MEEGCKECPEQEYVWQMQMDIRMWTSHSILCLSNGLKCKWKIILPFVKNGKETLFETILIGIKTIEMREIELKYKYKAKWGFVAMGRVRE